MALRIKYYFSSLMQNRRILFIQCYKLNFTGLLKRLASFWGLWKTLLMKIDTPVTKPFERKTVIFQILCQ